MDWLANLLSNPGALSMLIPIVAIVGAFVIAGLKLHYRHQERMEKIRHGIDPDQQQE